jgi:PAS domain S-box-containing protein
MTLQKPREPQEDRNRWSLVLLLVAVAAGAAATWWTVWRRDYEMRVQLLAQTRRVAQALNPEDIVSLSGTEADSESPTYHRLKQLLVLLRQLNEECRFVYVMGRRADGDVFLFADSESPDSEDYSPPGQVYSEAGAVEARAFETGEPIVYGPTTDRWGTWVSAYVPVRDPRTSRVDAMLGMDIDARAWNRDLARAALLPVVSTFVLVSILMVGVFLAVRRRRLAAAAPPWLRYLQPAVVVAGGLVVTFFTARTVCNRESFNRARVFDNLAAAETYRVADILLDLQRTELESLARFYENSDYVSWGEFERFTMPLAANPAIQAWEWLAAVPAADKEAFEQEAGNEGLEGFETWEQGQHGARVPAEGREMYFPVFRVVPSAGNDAALGFDVGSEPVRRAALEEAVRTRRRTATRLVTLVQESGNQKGMVLFRPVFATGEEGRLRGFAVAVIRMGDLVASVQDKASVHLSLAVLSESRASERLASACDHGAAASLGYSFSRPVDIGGQVLVVTAHPGPDFVRRYSPYQAGFLMALAGTLLTALVAVLIGVPIHRRANLERLVAEQTVALRDAESRYYQVARQSRTFTWEVDADGVYTYVSPLVEMILGYRPEELTGRKRFFDLWAEAEREALLEGALEISAAKREFLGFENPVVTRSGSVVWISTNGIPILDTNGTLLGYRGADTDISQRHKAEQNYQTLFREMSDGFALHEIVFDAQGEPVDYRFLDVNPAFERLTGLRLEDVLGKTVLEVLPDTESHWIETYARVALTGEPVSFEAYSATFQKTFDIAAFRPAPHQFACVFQDITQRKGLETERARLLAASERARIILLNVLEDHKRAEAELARLAAAIEQVDETVVITGPDGAIQYVNPAFTRTTGYARDEALGQNPRILKSGQQDPAYYRQLWETISSGRTWEGRFVNQRKDGNLYIEDATISPVRDPAGRIVNYVAVKRDITEHLRAVEENDRLEERMQQMQKVESIGRLAGGVAHDFNNMLSVILGYGEHLLEQLPPENPLRESATQIVEAGRRSAALTRQLLAFSRRQPLQPDVLDLNALIADLEPMLRRLIGEHIELRVACCPTLYHVKADRGQIEQTIVNLAVNARDAMPDGGRLVIETAKISFDAYHALTHLEVAPGDYAMLAVTDTGCGMDQKTLAQIFEPFFTTKGRTQGTGLGLATAYGIIRQSGGQIEAESEPGKGTAVRFYLPRTLAELPSQPQAPELGGSEVAGEQILVVEDEASLRTWIARVLSARGYRTSVAADGPDALRLIQQQGLRPDLLLTDVIMPEMSGTDLATRLRSMQPNLKVLYMSGYSDDLIEHHGALEPGVHFLAKPFHGRDLTIKVREVLGSRSQPGPRKNVLMIDDEAIFRELIGRFCSRQGHRVHRCGYRSRSAGSPRPIGRSMSCCWTGICRDRMAGRSCRRSGTQGTACRSSC